MKIMTDKISIAENGLYVEFRKNEKQQLQLVHFSSLPLSERDLEKIQYPEIQFCDKYNFRPVELQVTGLNSPNEREGNKYAGTNLGVRLTYCGHETGQNGFGKKLILYTEDKETGIQADLHYQFFTGIPIIRSWTEVRNSGKDDVGLEYVSSFSYCGLDKEGIEPKEKKCRIYIPRNGWEREMQWQSFTLEQLGIVPSEFTGHPHSTNTISATNTGNWSTKEYLPLGFFENQETNTNLFWQIEHNGSWHWEISDHKGTLCLEVSGPSELESHWWKVLKPGESFVTVPAAAGSTASGFDSAMDALTAYRRRIRRDNQDDKTLPVIFNDYMNCLDGDPTTKAEIPLVNAAAEAGCEYYVIDCGWYSKGYWWDGVGEWLPYEERFPDGGLRGLMEYIRSKGMVPGLWLELEVIGIKSPMFRRLPPECFFQRHGKLIQDRSRYQLDYRHPLVRKSATEVIDRVVNEYGIGYIKMDYNIEPGIGTEYAADSAGDGLLEHERAYLSWIDSIFKKYPALVIENCSSGGMRIDYAMLSRHSIQSTSDQQDYRNYAVIAVNAPAALTPEQAAVWSYPMADGDEEETVFNMVNALLLRIHQSGHLARLSAERFALVKEGIACYKTNRASIACGVPFWPLGLAHYGDEWLCLGMRDGKKLLIAVWRKNSTSPWCSLPVSFAAGMSASVSCVFPRNFPAECSWNKVSGTVSVKLPGAMTARLFEMDIA
jgi:alpha-galactosidase